MHPVVCRCEELYPSFLSTLAFPSNSFTVLISRALLLGFYGFLTFCCYFTFCYNPPSNASFAFSFILHHFLVYFSIFYLIRSPSKEWHRIGIIWTTTEPPWTSVGTMHPALSTAGLPSGEDSASSVVSQLPGTPRAPGRATERAPWFTRMSKPR